MKKKQCFSFSHYLLSTLLPHPNLSEDWLYFGQLSHLKTNSRKKIFFFKFIITSVAFGGSKLFSFPHFQTNDTRKLALTPT